MNNKTVITLIKLNISFINNRIIDFKKKLTSTKTNIEINTILSEINELEEQQLTQIALQNLLSENINLDIILKSN